MAITDMEPTESIITGGCGSENLLLLGVSAAGILLGMMGSGGWYWRVLRFANFF